MNSKVSYHYVTFGPPRLAHYVTRSRVAVNKLGRSLGIVLPVLHFAQEEN
ncbi:MAG: hypothetical protein JWR53_895 [Glaciihabitans sp.]|nr:hypothetical protein [Glaciihabitans sp.]